MPTQHVFRLIAVVPVARVNGVATWLAANIDPQADLAIGPALNASGLPGDAVTHRWMCGAYQDAEAKAILLRVCQLASVTPPTNPQWNGWTRAEKLAWLASVRAALLAGFGIWVGLADNEGAWDDRAAVLANLGLKAITEG